MKHSLFFLFSNRLSSFSRGTCAARSASDCPAWLSAIALDTIIILILSLLFSLASTAFALDESRSKTADVLNRVLPKMVKIYGAGGPQGLEAYQSGFLISPEGYVLTAYSYVLDTDYITVVLADGRKLEAQLLGADLRLEVAVLKLSATDLPYFDLAKAPQEKVGAGVLALSNLFNVALGDEPASVQHGIISTITKLDARRGVFETPYRGSVYVLDAKTNNPGSAGGALVNYNGELLGILGKELKNSRNDTWLNYAIPIAELRASVEAICAGKFVAQSVSDPDRKSPYPLDLESLGIALIPDVLERTPPYVDYVYPDSPAEKAGVHPDDLIVLVGDRLVQSCKLLHADLECLDASDPVRITVLRGQELVEFVLQQPAGKETP
jgi:S1-C subfamily serine protease